MGLLSKLMDLQRYRLNFLVDDSGSMRAPTDVQLSEAVPHVLRGQPVHAGMFMTRWQEGMYNVDIKSYFSTTLLIFLFGLSN